MMKKIKINRLWVAVGCMLFLLSSCTEDFLTVPVEDALTVDNFYETDEQLLSATAPLYGQSYFKLQDKGMYSLDMLAGNSIGFGTDSAYKRFTVNPSNGVLYEMWSALYKGITDANLILEVLQRDDLNPDISEDVLDRVEAEARFARAFSYYWLVRLWGPVPVIDEVTSETSELYKLNTVASIYNFIEQEFIRVASLLPLASDDMRRIGKTAPWAYLAEMHLTLRNYDKAKDYAKMVMDSGIHSLQSNFQDQFINPKLSINSETIFALQFKVNCGQWGTQNTNQAYLTVSDQDITGDDGSFGTVAAGIDLILAFNKMEEGGLVDKRREYTITEPGRFYPELRTADDGYLVPPSGHSPTATRYRKYVVGSPEEYPGEVCFMRTEMSSHMMRYADVLLIYAEAILGDANSTGDAEALAAFNLIRERAGLPLKTIITRQSMREERRVEFALEAGKYWFDLLRMDRNIAKDILSVQERGTLESYDPFVLAGSETLGDAVNNDFEFPIPAAELSFIDMQSSPVDYEYVTINE